ncbi:MAG: cysteine-rich small domain-containing protein [Anaerovoracaceae bacterium]
MCDKKENFKYFRHESCEFFPCHKTDNADEFNCLFCYCPLYALGEECGGNFIYLENGVKDCSDCRIPHSRGGYDYIMKNYSRLIELIRGGRK